MKKSDLIRVYPLNEMQVSDIRKTISIYPDTKKRLDKLKLVQSESYDDLLNRLIRTKK